MKLKKIHDYIFYRFYKSVSKMDTDSWLDMRAAFSVAIVELLLFFVICIPVEFITSYRILSKELLLVMAVLTGLKSYLYFFRNEAWKSIIEEFDQLPPAVNKKYKRIFWLSVSGLVAIFVLEMTLVAITSDYS